MVSPTSEQYDSLLRQMWERMDEGCGETIYVIGQGSGKYSIVFSMPNAEFLRNSSFAEVAQLIVCEKNKG